MGGSETHTTNKKYRTIVLRWFHHKAHSPAFNIPVVKYWLAVVLSGVIKLAIISLFSPSVLTTAGNYRIPANWFLCCPFHGRRRPRNPPGVWCQTFGPHYRASARAGLVFSQTSKTKKRRWSYFFKYCLQPQPMKDDRSSASLSSIRSGLSRVMFEFRTLSLFFFLFFDYVMGILPCGFTLKRFEKLLKNIYFIDMWFVKLSGQVLYG